MENIIDPNFIIGDFYRNSMIATGASMEKFFLMIADYDIRPPIKMTWKALFRKIGPVNRIAV